MIDVRAKVDKCENHHREYEDENLHFSRWGEKSDRYWKYSMGLFSIHMQLEAGSDSYELGFWRILFFKTGMWEKVANEFYEEEI